MTISVMAVFQVLPRCRQDYQRSVRSSILLPSNFLNGFYRFKISLFKMARIEILVSKKVQVINDRIRFHHNFTRLWNWILYVANNRWKIADLWLKGLANGKAGHDSVIVKICVCISSFLNSAPQVANLQFETTSNRKLLITNSLALVII